MIIPQLNTRAGIQHRVDARLSWLGPSLMVIARLSFAMAAQAGIVSVLLLRGRAQPWLRAAPWWSVYGTLIDIGCLLALTYLMRREGGRVLDLIGVQRARFRRDLLLGLAYALMIFPFAILGGFVGTALIYGSAPAPIPLGPLPLLGALYSLFIWPVIWAVTEELTYLGYALPRLVALTGRTWIALLVVVFFWSVQHCVMPIRFDLRFMLWRAITSFPVVLILSSIFIRTRRLLPLIVAHWLADAVAVLMVVLLPLLRR